MENLTQQLPTFSDPPVVETVLSAQFEPIAGLKVSHFGLYWREIADRFPNTEERAEVKAVIETFLEAPNFESSVHFEALDVPPMPRVWFINEVGTEVVQVQRDRFIKNWREQGSGDAYPRYPNLRMRFDADFAHFTDFVKTNALGNIVVNQCEVTYVNHVEGISASDVAKVFSIVVPAPGSHPGPIEAFSYSSRFVIKDRDGNPVGRLHVGIQSTKRATDGKPIIAMNLTARGQVGSGLDFLDVGREWIVKSLKELTLAEMHEKWGLQA